MKSNLTKFQKKIKIRFKDINLLKETLTHKRHDPINNYEKLEFLGDRVLGLILAKTLLKIFPKEKEGIIDKKLASLVNKKTCADIAKKINIQKFMLLGQSYKKLKRSDEKMILCRKFTLCRHLTKSVVLVQNLPHRQQVV